MTLTISRGFLILLLTIAAAGMARALQEDDKHQERETKPLDLRVRPQATQSPGTIRITATMERHAANREITIEAESGGFLRSSSRSLEGAAAPRAYTRVFANLPPGKYEVSATLERNDGTQLLEVTMVEVFGPSK
jgi:hypothetical protein